MTETNVPIACNLSVFGDGRREEHTSTVHQIFAAVQEVRELPDGYAFRLPPESDMLQHAAEFIANERLCCPFFGFALELEPQSAALWLRLTGGEGVKQFLQADLGGVIGQAVAKT